MNSYRLEKDTFGHIKVPNKNFWGAQTQRSLQNFNISIEKQPKELIYALAIVKKACAKVNCDLDILSKEKAQAIIEAVDLVINGNYPNEFPLSVWQTGSGTQTNMNMNEVLANIASKILGGEIGENRKIHPNDDVNKSQSSNDVFPTAMHISCVITIQKNLLPAILKLKTTLNNKSEEFKSIVKIGRTHLQDATPLTLGQEFSGYVSALEHSYKHILDSLNHLYELALGGTAVGTGLNAPKSYAENVAKEIANLTGYNFITSANKFESLATTDAIVNCHGALKTLSASLMKIANDIRWLASGPRSGIGEINIPENEPGSSIMPGKVNPTQCEAITMICAQVFGNDVAINFGGASGNFELNVFRPMISYNLLQSIRILADGIISFNDNCCIGITPNINRITQLVNNSLMLVTALNTHIGYDKAAQIAKKAYQNGSTLKEAAIATGFLTEEEFDKWVVPEKMIGNN